MGLIIDIKTKKVITPLRKQSESVYVSEVVITLFRMALIFSFLAFRFNFM